MGSFCFSSGRARGMGSVRAAWLSANLPCKTGLRLGRPSQGRHPKGCCPRRGGLLPTAGLVVGRVRPAEDHLGLDSLPDVLSWWSITDRANEAHGHGVNLTQVCQMHKLKVCPLPGFELLTGQGHSKPCPRAGHRRQLQTDVGEGSLFRVLGVPAPARPLLGVPSQAHRGVNSQERRSGHVPGEPVSAASAVQSSESGKQRPAEQ